ncbi:MAG: GNAT family N-acetyltransferase [Mycobacteriales bacterium]
MADVSVRPATAADAGEIARIQLVTWRTAYADVVPARVLDRLTAEDVAATWVEAVENPPSARHRVLIALEQDLPVGFVAVAPAVDEGHDPTKTGLVTTLLVEPRWGRRGHGSRLLAASVELLRADAADIALTWVFDRDPASRKFYESAGWAADGAARYLDMDGQMVTEVRLHTSLTEPADTPEPPGAP